MFLNIKHAIPCGLIISELVSNALKHAFPEGKKGELTIIMKADSQGKYSLTVQDNGAGLPEDVDPRRPQTFGMQLIHDLVN